MTSIMQANLVHIFGGIVSIYLAAVVEVESLGLTAALQPSDVLILVGGV
jgi:hypothetical protein